MRQRLLGFAAAAGVGAMLAMAGSVGVAGQAARPTPAPAGGTAGFELKTPWGDPDLQGIWAVTFQVPLQRPSQYAGKEFFTDAEIEQLDKERATLARRDDRAGTLGSEADVAGAYNAVFNNFYHTGRRTSLIVDPPDGRMPAYTTEVRARMQRDQEFWGALNQATDVCKDRQAACSGAKYGPPSPRRSEVPPSYQMNAINRADNPEDTGLQTRCLLTPLPDFGNGNTNFGGNYRRIVQSPGALSMFVDFGQGGGFPRVIPITTQPHLPETVRQWWGDSRGHWEGSTLVVDVTNFTPKSDYLGARENLHLIERYTRTGPETLEYAITLEDPTTWVRPWTMKQDLFKNPDEPNRIYYEPRCHEGNYGLAGILRSGRAEDQAFAEGRGPNPATRCVGGTCRGGENEQFGRDPLQ
jgi:hypothetical protein